MLQSGTQGYHSSLACASRNAQVVSEIVRGWYWTDVGSRCRSTSSDTTGGDAHMLCQGTSTSPAEDVRMHGIGPEHMIGELHGMEGDEVGVQSVWTASTKCLGLSQVGFEEVPKELRLDIIWYCVAISLVQNIVVRSQGALMYRPPTAFPILSLLYQNSSVCIPGGHSCNIVEHEVGAMSSLLLLFHPIRLGIFSILSPSLLSLLSLSIRLSTCLLFNVSALQRFCSSTFPCPSALFTCIVQY
jgi:hypothetical protein